MRRRDWSRTRDGRCVPTFTTPSPHKADRSATSAVSTKTTCDGGFDYRLELQVTQ